MTKREFLDIVFALAPTEANAIMDAFDEYVDSNEPHWIPVTEKLPEKDGRYYVTLENKYVEILYYAVEQTIRHPKGFYYLSEDGRMTWRQTQNPVIAWCELPKSFEGVTR